MQSSAIDIKTTVSYFRLFVHFQLNLTGHLKAPHPPTQAKIHQWDAVYAYPLGNVAHQMGHITWVGRAPVHSRHSVLEETLFAKLHHWDSAAGKTNEVRNNAKNC